MSNTRKKNKTLWIIAFTLIAILSVSMIFAFGRIMRNEKTKTLGQTAFTYEVGLLNATDGKEADGKTSIRTKNFYTVDGITCKLAEDAKITYRLFYYDEDEKFVSASNEFSADYDGSTVPATAKYFKVMITPTDDTEITFFEIGGYASQVEVTINK